jgi:hypothetical protein
MKKRSVWRVIAGWWRAYRVLVNAPMTEEEKADWQTFGL